LLPEHAVNDAEVLVDVFDVATVKMEPIAAATISVLPVDTTAITLNGNSTRYRCMLAPIRTASIACIRPE
jgi:hypothetical protein